MAAVTEVQTQLCGNCKKNIPAANFTIHEIHCSRNLEVCHYCNESVPKAEMKNHIDSEHVQVTCKCSMKVEKSLLEDHETLACPLRPAVCQHCDIQLTFNKLQDHENYCGARTEMCSDCGLNVMVKDLKEHPQVCGKEVKRVSKTVPRFEGEDAGLRSLRDIRNQLRSDNCAGPLWRMPRALERQIYSNCVGDRTLKDISRRNVSRTQRNQNQEYGLEQLERNKNTNSLYEEQNANLDHMLALSLQNENNPRNNTAAKTHRDVWENHYAKEFVPSSCPSETDNSNTFPYDSLLSLNTSNHMKCDEIMLPCEFCEELYPAEDLILHQTGCNPASAFASFSKRSSLDPQKHDDLPNIGYNSCRSDYSSWYPAVQEEANIIIPCEFCGIQLEEEILFHHQDQCDLRPATANPADNFPSQQPPSPRDNRERRESPELARRRIRHQGDVSPRCIEGFRQQRLNCPARGNRALSNAANARNAPLTSSGTVRTGDALNSRGKPRKVAGNEGRLKNRDTGEPAGGATPRVRPTQNLHSETFTSSLSRTSPVQPSIRNEGGRNLGMSDVPAGFRNRKAKAKPQSPESGYPEEE
ncbi:TRAF-type zinc finger domain-containing protein 1 [Phasianus colchicus]|uniref:TRAF-type zinc finger domain-containing protein 1 n=1 Tax=Phasianus colchicus TaxID=9054 RepID=UPI00129D8A93|nr:TRAF-type zinc finger domain-containing protein 1 [Phasianus colchicus]